LAKSFYVYIINTETAAHANTTESTWRHVKATLCTHHKNSDYIHVDTADYMFSKKCKKVAKGSFCEFMMLAIEMFCS
jgi:hypothetical protein